MKAFATLILPILRSHDAEQPIQGSLPRHWSVCREAIRQKFQDVRLRRIEALQLFQPLCTLLCSTFSFVPQLVLKPWSPHCYGGLSSTSSPPNRNACSASPLSRDGTSPHPVAPGIVSMSSQTRPFSHLRTLPREITSSSILHRQLRLSFTHPLYSSPRRTSGSSSSPPKTQHPRDCHQSSRDSKTWE